MDDIDARFSSFNRPKKFPLYPHPLPSHYNRHDYLDEDAVSDEEENVIDSDENDGNYNPRVYSSSRGFPQNDGAAALERYPKRRKVRNSSASNYEFAPRTAGWSEHEKFVLLEVWGDRFLQLGRSSLRSEDWADVAEKVSETSRITRTEAQCRQMMDILKRKYKKEKAKGGNFSRWAYFKKIDMLMRQEKGGVGGGVGLLACGVDSGEYCFKDTHVYLDFANLNDEMRDSPCESEEDDDEEKMRGGHEGLKGLRVLADSVQKFGEIYEKIESSKREHMMELERMREEFQRELELQKKQILERAQLEIAKLRDGDEEEEDEEDTDYEDDNDGDSMENVSE